MLQYLWRRAKEINRSGEIGADYLEPEYLASVVGIVAGQEEELTAQVEKILHLGFFLETERGTYRVDNWARFQLDAGAAERQRARRTRCNDAAAGADCHGDTRDVTVCHGDRRDVTAVTTTGRDNRGDLGVGDDPGSPPPQSTFALAQERTTDELSPSQQQEFIPLTDRERAMFEALGRATFYIPGAGNVIGARAVKDPGVLARALAGPAYANVPPEAIDHAGNWSMTNVPKAKKDIARFLINWFAREHEAIGRRLPAAAAMPQTRPRRDLEAVVRDRVYGGGEA